MPELNPREMQQALAQPFAPEDLEWRLQNTIEDKMRGMAVPYVTNRAIQNRLDEVCGPENWYNEFKSWHSNGTKGAQLCGIAIYFEGKGFITKWDGAEDSDIEPIKGGLSDSMKRAANQWGIGRVLYSLDTVWVDIEGNGKSFFIKNSEREKLDRAYLNTLKKLGLEPAKACGIQSLLTPKTVPEQKNTRNKTPMGAPGQEPRQPAAKPLEQPAQCPPVHNERRDLVEHELLRIEDVVHIDEVGKGGLDAGQVAGGEDDVLVGLSGHDQSLAVGVDCAQETGELLGLDLVHLDLVDDDDVSGLSLGAQNGLQSQTADLLVERVAVIAGLRGKDDAAVRPLRGAGAALAGVAGALLLPGLLAAAGDLGAG